MTGIMYGRMGMVVDLNVALFVAIVTKATDPANPVISPLGLVMAKFQSRQLFPSFGSSYHVETRVKANSSIVLKSTHKYLSMASARAADLLTTCQFCPTSRTDAKPAPGSKFDRGA